MRICVARNIKVSILSTFNGADITPFTHNLPHDHCFPCSSSTDSDSEVFAVNVGVPQGLHWDLFFLHFTFHTVSRNPLVWIELYAIRGRYSGLHSSRQNLQLPTCIPGRMSQCSSHLATPQFTVSKPCQIWCHRRQSPAAYHEGWYSISFWSTSHSIFNCEESWRSARQHVFHGSTCCSSQVFWPWPDSQISPLA